MAKKAKVYVGRSLLGYEFHVSPRRGEFSVNSGFLGDYLPVCKRVARKLGLKLKMGEVRRVSLRIGARNVAEEVL